MVLAHCDALTVGGRTSAIHSVAALLRETKSYNTYEQTIYMLNEYIAIMQ